MHTRRRHDTGASASAIVQALEDRGPGGVDTALRPAPGLVITPAALARLPRR